MPLDYRFPMYPGRAFGYLYGRGDATVVVWGDDQTFEPAPGGDMPIEELEDFSRLLADIRRLRIPNNWEAVHREILAAGWEDRGLLRYEVQSGLLLASSTALADEANRLWEEREQLCRDAGGRHPVMGSPSWGRWVVVTTRRRGAVLGARALAVAAVEALVNELLAARHPREYEEWETRNRRGFQGKLRGLLDLHGVSPEELRWFRELEPHTDIRNRIFHHRPSWIIDDRDDDSVSPEPEMTKESLDETVQAAEAAIEGLCALYGVAPPPTHRLDWLTSIS